MGLLDSKLGAGLAVGVGALVILPAVLPAVGKILRPIVVASIKGGIVLAEKATQLFAEAKETMEDIPAEAQAELAGERLGAAASAPENGAL